MLGGENGEMRRWAAGFVAAMVTGILCLTFAVPAGAAGHVAASSFNQANFTNPTGISNQYLPLAPGRQFTLKGRADRGDGLKPHTSIFTVTGLTKVLNGVKTRVVWDQDINDGTLVEAELAFFAQDKNGTVWVLGEYPEEFEGGVFVGAPSAWAAGFDGASAGIAMQATPTVGQPAYSQGFAPEIEFGDLGRVIQTGATVCLSPASPLGCFSNVVVVEEQNTFAPEEGFQRKSHAPGVGVVLVKPVGGLEGEQLELVKQATLTGSALSAANYEAIRLDRRAYAFSEIYRATAPAQPG